MSFHGPRTVRGGWSALGHPGARCSRRSSLTGSPRPAAQDLDTGLFVDVLSAVPIWSQLVRPGGGFSIESAYATVDLLLTGPRHRAAAQSPGIRNMYAYSRMIMERTGLKEVTGGARDAIVSAGTSARTGLPPEIVAAREFYAALGVSSRLSGRADRADHRRRVACELVAGGDRP